MHPLIHYLFHYYLLIMKSYLIDYVIIWTELSYHGILKFVRDQNVESYAFFPKFNKPTDGYL